MRHLSQPDVIERIHRAYQQSLILADFIEGHCSKAEALSWQLQAITDDLRAVKEYFAQDEIN